MDIMSTLAKFLLNLKLLTLLLGNSFFTNELLVDIQSCICAKFPLVISGHCSVSRSEIALRSSNTALVNNGFIIILYLVHMIHAKALFILISHGCGRLQSHRVMVVIVC